MSLHSSAVFKNSCLKVPVDPLRKLPTTEYERLSLKDATKRKHKRNSFDSISTEDTILKEDMPVTYLQEFYNSIPDYRELTHLSNQEFYSKLDDLKKKKRQLLRRDENRTDEDFSANLASASDCYIFNNSEVNYNPTKCKKSEINYAIQRTYDNANDKVLENSELSKNRNDTIDSLLVPSSLFENKYFKTDNPPDIRIEDTELKIRTETTNLTKEKRNNSACSITWDDNVKYKGCDGNEDSRTSDSMSCHKNKEIIISPKRSNFRSLSVPTSPIKVKGSNSSEKHLTVQKPFKMTMRDEDESTVRQLQSCTKSLSDDLIVKDAGAKTFRANPVPIESRILLYDKILQDQEMRRTVSKINSMAELQSKMKPFSFTEKDECRPKFCSKRFSSSQPHLNMPASPKKDRHFRAKPVPRNLFSNYVYDKMREDDFYRALNRRIRAEELLRASSLPPSMAEREKTAKRSVNSTPCCYRPSNETASSGSGSSASQKRNKKSKKTKRSAGAAKVFEKELENLHEDFISTSPHPFHFKTANRIGRRAALKKIYSSQSVPSETLTGSSSGATNRPQSAFEVRSVNRSNLAAVLRIESAKKKIDQDVKRKMDEDKFKTDLKWRDNVLRKKPAWQTLKYSQDEDIAIRLQTRRDEDRLRREQFLHEMELMYGRVQQQPLLFERYYPSCGRKSRKEIMRHIEDDLNSLASKVKSRNSSASRKRSVALGSPVRKVSLDGSFKQHFDSYATGKSIDQINASDSDEVPESIYGD